MLTLSTFRFAVEVQRSPTLTPVLPTMPLCKRLLSKWPYRPTLACLTPSNSPTISLNLSDRMNLLRHWTQQRRAQHSMNALLRYGTLRRFMQISPHPPSASSATEVKIDYIKGQPTCLSRLRQIRELLLLEEPPAPFLVQQTLGHGVLAGK